MQRADKYIDLRNNEIGDPYTAFVFYEDLNDAKTVINHLSSFNYSKRLARKSSEKKGVKSLLARVRNIRILVALASWSNHVCRWQLDGCIG
ncbi:hypothetical protein IEQ34_000657 [Dendrobium chrysotoxum]|uniref:RRM domain-containing protein n=1 Tax=Dendrobium chrysotoxum TaxID=161865 RepID=A0AAV7HRU5_DENCH|nr:hypothetical protein IEQ34_000657 [Dendrobium chrysotoxum]